MGVDIENSGKEAHSSSDGNPVITQAPRFPFHPNWIHRVLRANRSEEYLSK